jgi:FkbM family methyltransferase
MRGAAGKVKLEQIQGTPTVVDNRPIYESALAYCPKRRVALDIGAYQGEWSRMLAQDFGSVYAWEIRGANRAILRRDKPDNVVVLDVGLGSGHGVDQFTLRGGYAQHVALGRSGKVLEFEVTPLDSYQLLVADFMKIDVDGSERNVIYGAVETIKRCKPVIVIETKFLNELGKRDLLGLIGYESVAKVSPIDEVWVGRG